MHLGRRADGSANVGRSLLHRYRRDLGELQLRVMDDTLKQVVEKTFRIERQIIFV